MSDDTTAIENQEAPQNSSEIVSPEKLVSLFGETLENRFVPKYQALKAALRYGRTKDAKRILDGLIRMNSALLQVARTPKESHPIDSRYPNSPMIDLDRVVVNIDKEPEQETDIVAT